MNKVLAFITIFILVSSMALSSRPTSSGKACLDQGGNVEQGRISSPLLKLPMEYRVYLPPCYQEDVNRRYPVLYLIHGQNYNEDQWERLGVKETADRLIAAGEIPALIIVMPRDRNWDQPTVDMFGRVVSEKLIPWIDQNYRTFPDRGNRAIGGLSRGAGWAVHLGLSHWEQFGALGGHSLPVFWSDTSKIRGWLADIPENSMPRIYLDIGDKDRPPIMASVVWFETLLSRLGIPHEWRLFNGYHEEAYWAKHLPDYLRWYSLLWQD